MTVDDAISLLLKISREGNGNKKLKVWLAPDGSELQTTREVLSINYISLRAYDRDFVEIV